MDDILFLAHRIPYPPDRGDKIRSWNMLRHLAGLGRVHLACFADGEADAAQIGPLREALGGRLGEAHVEKRSASRVGAALRALGTGAPVSLPLFDSAGMRGFVARLLRERPIATIFAFSGQMAQFVPAPCRQRFIMDFVDMDSAKFAAYADAHGGPAAWIHAREARRLFAFERATAARADVSLFVSEEEAALFRGRAALPNADIRAIHNGVDLEHYVPVPQPAGEGPLIVFTGQMDYRPNVEAVAAFARDAMPLILARVPEARFAIVGRNPAPEVLRLDGCGGVTVTGEVEDVLTWLAAAAVVVAPLRIARGVQNKVLEAMAMGRAVVASPQAFAGIEAEAGRDLIVADGAEAQAEAVLALLCNPKRAERIGAAARRRVEQAYRWEARLAPLAGILAAPARKVAA